MQSTLHFCVFDVFCRNEKEQIKFYVEMKLGGRAEGYEQTSCLAALPCSGKLGYCLRCPGAKQRVSNMPAAYSNINMLSSMET